MRDELVVIERPEQFIKAIEILGRIEKHTRAHSEFVRFL
jgi:hypothetical protein